ncbi:exopolysaccharide biosynthesis acetyltransferase VpsC [Vibrio sp. dsl-7]|uniref:Exopolysaccharide biosynthesis acetyltransferase VpsC n=1 Tax=Vibrio chanodichtyis TaxID=3027932 RepID=A0ABT5UVD6_9VIBR|nr:exopolysaccharide biosynthesis acetyltransferase VpsC [Vibrio chanodichtyis]MDE1513397.1 exopolysaccharide biosynthesis acetyltransferase VpsC [Vibrio chanodichtyis]
MSSPWMLIKADLYRHTGRVSFGLVVKHLLLNAGFCYMFWFRLCRSQNLLLRTLARVMHRMLSIRYQIQLPKETQVGPGLYLGHATGVIVNSTAIIGANCNLSPFTVIGSNQGQAAIIENNVYIGPHVALVENITLGEGAIIGAGSVVTHDVAKHTVVAGNPARVIRTSCHPSYIRNPVTLEINL